MKNKKIFLAILILVFSGLLFYGGLEVYQAFKKGKETNLSYGKRMRAWSNLQRRVLSAVRRFKGDSAVVIRDLSSGREFSYNKDKLFASASIVKIPIMAACFLAAEEGRLKLDDRVKLEDSDKISGSGILKNIRAGNYFSVEELIGLMIYDSDNTATNMLTTLVGIDYLNASFKKFGLKDTSLSRRVADFSARDKGIENYTSAGDIALILDKIYRSSLVNRRVSEECMVFLKLQRVNDRIPKYLPPSVTVAHKTGLERSVCHDAGIIFTKKGNFLLVVFTGHNNPNSFPSKEFIAKVSLRVYEYSRQL
jgi:beta-lactamase class A